MAPTGDHYSLRFSLTPFLTPSDRRTIVVRSGEPVLIGRASNSPNKSLPESPSNALFDCSVISRTHAIIEAHPWASSSEQIKITDRNSTHGTYVNGVRIIPGAPMVLKSGDHIRLGRPIARETGNRNPRLHTNHPANQNRLALHRPFTVVFQVLSAYRMNERYRAPSLGFHVSVPSDVSDAGSSDGEASYSSEDDDGEHASSAHTTPDKPKAPLGSQQQPIDLAAERVADDPSIIDISEDESLVVAPSKSPQRIGRLAPEDTVVPDTQRSGTAIIPNNHSRVVIIAPATNASVVKPVALTEQSQKDDHTFTSPTSDPIVPDSLSEPHAAPVGHQESTSGDDDDVADEDESEEEAEEKLKEETTGAVVTASAITAAVQENDAANEDVDSDVAPEIMSSKGPQTYYRSVDGAPSHPMGMDMAASNVFSSYPLYQNTAMASDPQTALPTMSFTQSSWRSSPYGAFRSRYDPVRGSPAPTDFYSPFNQSSTWYHEPSYAGHETFMPGMYGTDLSSANTAQPKFPTPAPYAFVQPNASQVAYQPHNAAQSSQTKEAMYAEAFADGVDETNSIFEERPTRDDDQETPVIKQRLSISNLVNAKAPAATLNNQPETSELMVVVAEKADSPSARSSPLVRSFSSPTAEVVSPRRKRTFDEMEAAIETFDVTLGIMADQGPTPQNSHSAPSGFVAQEQQRTSTSTDPRKKKAKTNPPKAKNQVRRVFTNVAYLALGVVGTHLFYESSLSEKLINLLG